MVYIVGCLANESTDRRKRGDSDQASSWKDLFRWTISTVLTLAGRQTLSWHSLFRDLSLQIVRWVCYVHHPWQVQLTVEWLMTSLTGNLASLAMPLVQHFLTHSVSQPGNLKVFLSKVTDYVHHPSLLRH